MNWVYGFRVKDIKRPLECSCIGGIEKLFYFTANIVVVYFSQLKEQKHYLEHDSEIFCLAVSQHQNLVASGELGVLPCIHLWDSESLKNLGVIQGVHQGGIQQM